MDNLNKLGLVELNETELNRIDGGSLDIGLSVSGLSQTLNGLLSSVTSLLSGVLGTVTGILGGVLGGVL